MSLPAPGPRRGYLFRLRASANPDGGPRPHLIVPEGDPDVRFCPDDEAGASEAGADVVVGVVRGGGHQPAEVALGVEGGSPQPSSMSGAGVRFE